MGSGGAVFVWIEHFWNAVDRVVPAAIGLGGGDFDVHVGRALSVAQPAIVSAGLVIRDDDYWQEEAGRFRRIGPVDKWREED